MKKALLIGEYEAAMYHPLTGVDTALRECLSNEFQLDICEQYNELTEETLSQYQLLISYVDVGCYEKKASGKLTAAILKFVLNGGGLFALHNGIFLQHTPELAMALGAYLTKHPPYTTLNISIQNPSHPIVRGLGDFVIEDEPYTFEMDCFTERTLLLTYRFGHSEYPAAWCHRYGKGRIAYVSLGHEATSIRNASLREVIARCALWSCGEYDGEDAQ